MPVGRHVRRARTDRHERVRLDLLRRDRAVSAVRYRVVRWLARLCVLVAAGPARADDAAVAQQLYEKAKRLADEGKLAEACPLFASSWKADPQLGVLLNLADCHERIGKLASAWSEFQEAVNRANRIHDAREAYAQKRADALAPRLAKLHVAPPPRIVPNVVVRLDGTDITALVGTDTPVDPGDHELAVAAPGYVTWTKRFAIADSPVTTPIELGVLDKAPDKPAGEGTLTIVAPRADAEISIDGTTLGTGRYAGKVAAGGHTLRVVAPGMRVYQSEVFVGDGSARTIDVPLEAEAGAEKPMQAYRRRVRIIAFAGSGLAKPHQTVVGFQGGGRAKVSGEPIVVAAGGRIALRPWLDAQARLGFTYLPGAPPDFDASCMTTSSGTTSVTYVDLDATLRARPASVPWYLGIGVGVGGQTFGGTGSFVFTNCTNGTPPGSFTVDTAEVGIIGSALLETGVVFGAREQWELGVSARLGIVGGTDKIQPLDQVRIVAMLGYAFR